MGAQAPSRGGRVTPELLAIARQVPGFLNVCRGLEPDKKYQVILQPEVWEALRTGQARWSRDKHGLRLAVIHAGRGAGKKGVIAQIRLSEIPPDLAGALLHCVTSIAVEEIKRLLAKISAKLDELLEGQHTDRVAHVLNGKSLLEIGTAMAASSTRERSLCAAIQSLGQGRAELLLAADTAIQNSDRMRGAERRRLAAAVQRNFQHGVEASILIVGGLQALGEPQAAVVSLRPLAEFVHRHGGKGYELARLVTNNPKIPPEDLWKRTADALRRVRRSSLERPGRPAAGLALEFSREDVLGGDAR